MSIEKINKIMNKIVAVFFFFRAPKFLTAEKRGVESSFEDD